MGGGIEKGGGGGNIPCYVFKLGRLIGRQSAPADGGKPIEIAGNPPQADGHAFAFDGAIGIDRKGFNRRIAGP